MDTITATRETLLKKMPLDSSDPNFSGNVVELDVGDSRGIVSWKDAENGHYHLTLASGAGEWYAFAAHLEASWQETGAGENDPTLFFDQDVLRGIMPHASAEDIRTYAPELNKVCDKFDIETAARASAFIAQLAHESGSLRYKEEIASGAAYENRSDLGNDQPGDGVRFKGRGLIQLTGRANYRRAGKELGLDLINHPELVVADPYTNALVAGWFWHTRNLNALADKGDFRGITKRINGGYNGWDDRVKFWERAKKILLPDDERKIVSRWQDVIWDDFSFRITPNFTVREVTNGDRRRIPTDADIKKNIFNFAQKVQATREKHPYAILVNSWYRPPSINRAVGGSSRSRHMVGDAADLRSSGQDIYAFNRWLEANWFGAFGWGQRLNFGHVDSRNGKGFGSGGDKGVRWNY